MPQSSFEFEEWVKPFVGEAADGSRRPDFAAVMSWFRSVYDDVGPVSREEVMQRYESRQLVLAQEAAELVLRDAASTSEFAGTVSVDLRDGRVCVTVDGGYTTPSTIEFERPEVIAEIAEYLQEHIAEALWRAWPVCPRHDAGLYARVHDGEALWWCPADDHSVGPIGALEPNGGPP